MNQQSRYKDTSTNVLASQQLASRKVHTNRLLPSRSDFVAVAGTGAVGGSEGSGSASAASGLGITRLNIQTATMSAKKLESRRLVQKTRKLNRVLFSSDPVLKRLGKCGLVRHVDSVIGFVRQESGRCHFNGLITCGSVWSCIPCATKIRAKRAVEYTQMIRTHMDLGGGVLFLTLTSPHYRKDSLLDLWDINQAAWKYTTSGGAWKKFCQTNGIEALLITRETNHSETNGWHNHIHALIFTGSPVTSPLSNRYKNIHRFFFERWTLSIKRQNNRNVHEDIGVRLDIGKDSQGYGTYVTKLGMEMSLTTSKKGRKSSRTPYQIISDAANNGDMADIRLVKQWAASSKGRRCHTWKSGNTPIKKFRKHLMAEVEKTDEELAAEEVEGIVEGYLTAETCDYLNKGYTGEMADVITAWEQGGINQTRQTIERITGRNIFVHINHQKLPVLSFWPKQDRNSHTHQGLGAANYN